MNNDTYLIRVIFSFVILFMTSMGHAHNFQIKDGSDLYDAKIEVICSEDECSGLGKITLYQKNSQKIIQQFKSNDLNFYLNQKSQPTVNIIELYSEQSALIFDDFNFDGSEDIAIRNGNDGAYGGPTYDVYVFLKKKKKFIFSQELTDLTYANLGMFEVDQENKLIFTRSKSGCCYHQTAKYKVVPQKGLVMVGELIEDATSKVGQDRVKVIERNLKKGKWNVKHRYYPISEYYQ